MIEIQAKVTAKTTVNGKDFEFIFPNNIDIKDTTQALADIHQHLIDVVKEQNEKDKKEDEAAVVIDPEEVSEGEKSPRPPQAVATRQLQKTATPETT